MDTARNASTQPRRGRRPEVSREDWIAAGLKELGRHGEGALRLDRLCARLGITKGSFYWHFSGREQFVQEMLESWEKRDTLALIDMVEATGGSARDRLCALFRAANSGQVDFSVEQAVRHLGQGDAAVRRMLHRVDARRLEYLVDLFMTIAGDRPRAEACATAYYGLVLGEAMTFRREQARARAVRQGAALDIILSAAEHAGRTDTRITTGEMTA